MATKAAQAPEADRGARRLRPVPLHLGAALRDGAGRHEGPDLARLPQGLASQDGKAPLLLTAYGSYGRSIDAEFNSNRVSLLDRGVVFAVAHIRGGGELGKNWHDQGKMMTKKNTFTDFIAVAETLIAEKYTSKDRLVIEGGSAGGLLMGAVTNMRPDLFQAVIARVPFVDVINTMLDESLPLTVGEFEEWGNPKIPEQYDYMKSYSPYDNLEAKAYPAMLVEDVVQRLPGHVLGARQVRRQAADAQDRQEPADLQDQHGRRPRRLLGALRPA